MIWLPLFSFWNSWLQSGASDVVCDKQMPWFNWLPSSKTYPTSQNFFTELHKQSSGIHQDFIENISTGVHQSRRQRVSKVTSKAAKRSSGCTSICQKDKVSICHYGDEGFETLCLAESGTAAHMAHYPLDQCGVCTDSMICGNPPDCTPPNCQERDVYAGTCNRTTRTWDDCPELRYVVCERPGEKC